jgi:hypothetical protein
VGTSLKKENTESGSCVSGELMGSIDCDDNTGEFCSMETDVSSRDPSELYRKYSPLQNLLRRIDLKLPVSGGSSRLLLSSSVDDPSCCLLLKICPHRYQSVSDEPARFDEGR